MLKELNAMVNIFNLIGADNTQTIIVNPFFLNDVRKYTNKLGEDYAIVKIDQYTITFKTK